MVEYYFLAELRTNITSETTQLQDIFFKAGIYYLHQSCKSGRVLVRVRA